MTKTANDISIRWQIRRDVPEVLEIENKSFPQPWQEEDFLRCLRQRNCIGMVAEDREQKIRGFMLYELLKSQVRLLNLAVHPDHRWQGVGRLLVEKAKYKVTSHRRSHLTGLVRESNLEALRFCSRHGFRATAIWPTPYGEHGEDGIWMEWVAPPPSETDVWWDVPRNRVSQYREEP